MSAFEKNLSVSEGEVPSPLDDLKYFAAAIHACLTKHVTQGSNGELLVDVEPGVLSIEECN